MSAQPSYQKASCRLLVPSGRHGIWNPNVFYGFYPDERDQLEETRHRRQQVIIVKDKYFKRSVTIEPRLGRFREAATVAQAALLLLREWPQKGTRKHRAALQACLGALHGNKPPYVARRAFVAAAKEAGILTAGESRTV